MNQLLLNLRTTLGLSQKAIAQKLGVSQRIYSYWEKGERKPGKISLAKIKKLAIKYLCKNSYQSTVGSNQFEDIIYLSLAFVPLNTCILLHIHTCKLLHIYPLTHLPINPFTHSPINP